MKERIYVCHTFYHIYVAFLKEMNLPKTKRGMATLVISHMSTNFGNFPERVRSSGFFEEVVDFYEKDEKRNGRYVFIFIIFAEENQIKYRQKYGFTHN